MPAHRPDRQEHGVDLDQMLDLQAPWCLMVAATLRIPEHIASGHADIGDLAAAAGCDPDALHAPGPGSVFAVYGTHIPGPNVRWHLPARGA